MEWAFGDGAGRTGIISRNVGAEQYDEEVNWQALASVHMKLSIEDVGNPVAKRDPS